jgi:hypothetical protein
MLDLFDNLEEVVPNIYDHLENVIWENALGELATQVHLIIPSGLSVLTLVIVDECCCQWCYLARHLMCQSFVLYAAREWLGYPSVETNS